MKGCNKTECCKKTCRIKTLLIGIPAAMLALLGGAIFLIASRQDID